MSRWACAACVLHICYLQRKSLTFASRVLNIYNVSPLQLTSASATYQLNESPWVMTRDESWDESWTYMSPLQLTSASATYQLIEIPRWVMTRDESWDESWTYMSHEPTCLLRVMTLSTLGLACESWAMTHEPWVLRALWRKCRAL